MQLFKNQHVATFLLQQERLEIAVASRPLTLKSFFTRWNGVYELIGSCAEDMKVAVGVLTSEMFKSTANRRLDFKEGSRLRKLPNFPSDGRRRVLRQTWEALAYIRPLDHRRNSFGG